MNQKELLFFYRGVLLLIFGTIAVGFLSSIDRPWAPYFRNIGGIFLFFGIAAFTIFVSFRQYRQFRNAPTSEESLPPGLYSDYWVSDGSARHCSQRASFRDPGCGVAVR
jgi:hypothetical protein